MTTLKGQEELDQYKLTKREVADFLGISTNAVRMAQRGNNCHNLEYRFDGTKYLFKIPRRDPVRSRLPDHPSDHPGTPRSTPGSTPGLHKKIYNRGADARGEDNYTSNALRMHNDMKHRVALDKKFKSPEHKKVFMDMSESAFKEAYEISKRAKLKGLQENTRVTPEVFPGGNANSFHQSHGKYGTMLNAQGIAEAERKELAQTDRKYGLDTDIVYKKEYRNTPQFDGSYKRELVNTNEIDFGFSESSRFTPTGCYGGDNEYYERRDRGGVEITQAQINRATPIQERTDFSDKYGRQSKIEESIYRAKKHLLKTKGGWD